MRLFGLDTTFFTHKRVFKTFSFVIVLLKANHGGIRGKEIPENFFMDGNKEENGNDFESDDEDDYRDLVEHAKEVKCLYF